MNLQQFLAEAKTLAPKGNFAELIRNLKLEFGKRAPLISALEAHHERWQNGVTVGKVFEEVFTATKAVGTAPVPAVKVPDAAQAPVAPKQSLGAIALEAVTNPKTSGPAVVGLTKSIEAVQQMPDFSFVSPGMYRLAMTNEFKELGGLSPATHGSFMLHREKFFEKHGKTPEERSGAALSLPRLIPRAEVAAIKAEARKKSLRKI